MINPGNLIELSIGAILINNIVLTRFLGLCPVLGVSSKLSSAAGMGGAVIFVITAVSGLTWLVNHFILLPLHLEYLQTFIFILIIAGLVQLVEIVLLKYSPVLIESLGIYLPLITTNCAVLGVVIINSGENPVTGMPYTFIEGCVNGAMSGVGFTLALLLMAGIREKMEFASVPKALEGMPIAFITVGLMVLAFLGFVGLNFFPNVGG